MNAKTRALLVAAADLHKLIYKWNKADGDLAGQSIGSPMDHVSVALDAVCVKLVGIQKAEEFREILADFDGLAVGAYQKFMLINPAPFNGGELIAYEAMTTGQFNYRVLVKIQRATRPEWVIGYANELTDSEWVNGRYHAIEAVANEIWNRGFGE